VLRSGISVIIPAFNEEGTIKSVLSAIFSVMDSLAMPYEVIFIDDGSTDETLKRAQGSKAKILSNGKNQGKGYALRKGFREAQGEILVTIDSDGAHDPNIIPALIDPLRNGSDIVTGSRFLGNGTHFTTRINKLGNFMMNLSIALLTGKRITDSQTGFRAFKRSFLESINIESQGYEIETEMTVKGLKNGFRLKEIPIPCGQREYDISKLRILFDGMKIFRTILRASFEREPTKAQLHQSHFVEIS